MNAIPVDVNRVRNAGRSAGSTLEADLAAARFVAQLMDSKFTIGGVRFGMDALIGLVPGVGDLVSLGVGMFPVYLARKHGLGKRVVGRMLANLALDFAGGAVPLAGDVFDVFFKANKKNLALFEKALAKQGKL
jgi:hypothetical protein